MNVKNNVEVIECFAKDPLGFYGLLYDIVILFVQDGIKELVSQDQLQLVRDLEVTDMRSHIHNKFGTDNLKDKDVYEWYLLIKQTYLSSLIYIKYQNANYKIFNQKLTAVGELIKKMKTSTLNNNDVYQELIDFPKNIKNKTFRSNIKKKQQEIDSYFSMTKMCKLVHYIKKSNYTMNTDLNLAKEYFKMISSKKLKIKNLEGKKVNSDSDALYEFISYNLDQKVRESYLAKFAPDKETDTILNKISRKQLEATPDKIPYFYNLIKDPKRLSLVFKTKAELFAFVSELRSDKLFSQDFSREICFEKSNIFIRIKEVKNGFKDSKAGEYQDLKIIFEYYIADSDIAFQMECQCNLGTLIKWKTSEHVIYDYIRADDDYETVIAKLKEYRWLESTNRTTLQVIRNIVMLTSAILFWVLISYLSFQVYSDRFLINHINHRIDVGFVQGPANDVCLYGVGRNKYSCLGESRLENDLSNLSDEEIEFTYLYDDNYYNQGKNGHINTNQNQIQKINLFEFDSKHIQVSENYLYAVDLDNQIHIYDKLNNERINFYDVQEILKSGYAHNCIQNVKGFNCWGYENKGQTVVPLELQAGGLDLVALGTSHSCGQTETKLLCWGSNELGESDVPVEFQSGGLHLLAASEYTCGQSEDKLLCWGIFSIMYPSMYLIPVDFESGGLTLLEMNGSAKHSCGQNTTKTMCWGFNEYGQSDVPSEFESGGLNLLTLGAYHTCGQNEDKLLCWGQNYEGQTDVPSEFLSGGLNLIQATYKTSCGQIDYNFQCWGSFIRDGVPDEVPEEFLEGGVNLLTSGFDHFCGRNQYKLICWGENKAQQSDIFWFAEIFRNFPNEYDVTDNIAISINNYLCQKVTDSIICYIITQLGYSKLYAVRNVDPVSFCVYQYQDNLSTAVIAYVDKSTPNKIYRELLNEETSLDPVTVNLDANDSYNIVNLKCGSQHVCWLAEDGRADCADGSIESLEAELTEEMMSEVVDIYAGKFRTCVLKLGEVICNGYPINKTTTSSFADIT
eukprot:Mrub_00312.p1 GENE.Mrub_00312~~Mrub_00312.p1  ORF type:complete len:1169 (+),score=156.45 Mrub_00312:456-3509(+)